MRPRLRRTAEFNLRLAFPEWDEARRRGVIRGMVRNLGWLAAEFARFPRYPRENIEDVVVLDGHEHFLEGQRRGEGGLFLTGQIGGVGRGGVVQPCVCVYLHLMKASSDDNPGGRTEQSARRLLVE